MSKNLIAWIAAGFLLAVPLVTLSGMSGQHSDADGRESAPLVSELERAQAKLTSEMGCLREKLAGEMAALEQYRSRMFDKEAGTRIAEQAAQQAERAKSLAEEQARCAEEWGHELAERLGSMEPVVFPEDDESGWLGVTIEEVTAEKAEALKLPGERGVLVKEVNADSPAAKAGLKTGDVITEFKGQHVEGTVEFRRLVRETPAGRTVQLTIWREGRSQTLTAKLGSFPEHRFGFDMYMPHIEMFARTPMLGIEADEISGQLGSYFGVPDGEGILIREVRPGSPAEKAGLKAGDVITKMNGERVRSISDLRAKLREKRDQNSVSISVVRRGTETSFNVEMEGTKVPARGRLFSRRIAL